MDLTIKSRSLNIDCLYPRPFVMLHYEDLGKSELKGISITVFMSVEMQKSYRLVSFLCRIFEVP